MIELLKFDKKEEYAYALLKCIEKTELGIYIPIEFINENQVGVSIVSNVPNDDFTLDILKKITQLFEQDLKTRGVEK